MALIAQPLPRYSRGPWFSVLVAGREFLMQTAHFAALTILVVAAGLASAQPLPPSPAAGPGPATAPILAEPRVLSPSVEELATGGVKTPPRSVRNQGLRVSLDPAAEPPAETSRPPAILLGPTPI